MAITSLNDLFLHTLRDIYFAEKLLLKKLPDMADAATASALTTLFNDHFKQTEHHVKRLVQIFEILDQKAEGEECPAIEGIIEETGELLGEIKDAETRDAALISSAQAVEHYEITRYGTLVSWAKQLDLHDVANLLRETLAEEKDADNKLLRLGEDKLNKKAA